MTALTERQARLLLDARFCPLAHTPCAHRPIGGKYLVREIAPLRTAGLVTYDEHLGGWRITAAGHGYLRDRHAE